MAIIKFTKKHLQDAEDFSKKVDTSHYSRRSQTDPEKRRIDQVIGKLGELAVYEFLRPKYPEITAPDFKIYSAKEKSWDFDLKATNINLHVKSQNIKQSEKFGTSFIFQYGNGKNNHYDKEIFDRITLNQYIAMVVVDLDQNLADIKCIVSLDLLHDRKLFKLPIVPRLQQANKLAVYFKDLEHLTKEQLWQV